MFTNCQEFSSGVFQDNTVSRKYMFINSPPQMSHNISSLLGAVNLLHMTVAFSFFYFRPHFPVAWFTFAIMFFYISAPFLPQHSIFQLTDVHTRTQARAYTHMQTHANTPCTPHTNKLTCAHTHTHAHTQARTHARTHSLTHARKHAPPICNRMV